MTKPSLHPEKLMKIDEFTEKKTQTVKKSELYRVANERDCQGVKLRFKTWQH